MWRSRKRATVEVVDKGANGEEGVGEVKLPWS